jgi:hypothetical protein
MYNVLEFITYLNSNQVIQVDYYKKNLNFKQLSY